jgi:hypothetical protein
MNRSGKVIRILFIILFSLSGLTLSAQIGTIKDTVSLDSLLTSAKKLAYTDRKAEARKVCSRILSIDSTYWDAAVLMGRTYAWDEKYDSARIVLDRIIQQRGGYYDAVGNYSGLLLREVLKIVFLNNFKSRFWFNFTELPSSQLP